MRRQSHSQRKVKYREEGVAFKRHSFDTEDLNLERKRWHEIRAKRHLPGSLEAVSKIYIHIYIYIYFASRLWSRSREQRRYEIHRESNFTGSQFHYVTRMAIRLERACRGTDYCYHRSSPGFYTRTQTSEIIIYFRNIT